MDLVVSSQLLPREGCCWVYLKLFLLQGQAHWTHVTAPWPCWWPPCELVHDLEPQSWAQDFRSGLTKGEKKIRLISSFDLLSYSPICCRLSWVFLLQFEVEQYLKSLGFSRRKWFLKLQASFKNRCGLLGYSVPLQLLFMLNWAQTLRATWAVRGGCQVSEQNTKYLHVIWSNEILLSLTEEVFEDIGMSLLKAAWDAELIFQSNLQDVWQRRLQTNWKEHIL